VAVLVRFHGEKETMRRRTTFHMGREYNTQVARPPDSPRRQASSIVTAAHFSTVNLLSNFLK
jgi:hypothetical protein